MAIEISTQSLFPVRRDKQIVSNTIYGSGSSGVISFDSSVSGIQGIQGTQGTSGSQGAQGLTGEGFNWSGAWDDTTSYVVNDVVTYLNISYIAILGGDNHQPNTSPTYWEVYLTAIQGTQGVQGIQGKIGTQGTTGAIGPDGPEGDIGETGAQGVQGVQGRIGTQGTTGAQGVQGVQGRIGTQGTTGSQGIQGATGLLNDTSLNQLLALKATKYLVNSSTGLSDPAADGIYAFFYAGENVANRQVGYVMPSGYLGVADADASTKLPAIILNTSGVTLNTGAGTYLLTFGIYRNTTNNFIIGSPVYVGTDGYPTTTKPTTAGQCVQVIGIATSNDSLLFNPSPDVIVLK